MCAVCMDTGNAGKQSNKTRLILHIKVNFIFLDLVRNLVHKSSAQDKFRRGWIDLFGRKADEKSRTAFSFAETSVKKFDV